MKPRSLFAVLITLTMALGLAAGPLRAQTEPAANDEELDKSLPLDELRVFADVFGRIKQDYVESVDDRTLLRYAIRGMLSGLDPHSAYLDQDEFAELQVGTSGRFGGLGIEIGLENGFVKVISPIDDTPAERAGIQSGDLITRVDDQSTKGMTLDEAVKTMRGKVGTDIELTIVREGEDKPLKFTLTRSIIKVRSVRQRLLDQDYGYIRISQFQAHTSDDLVRALSKLKEENKGHLKGLVLDLRNNPGGVLNAAVSVSDAFLTDGVIVFTKGRIEDSELKFRAAPDDILSGAPMVVLVNGGSASASEIVAGALQDHDRAVIMGRPTFGKGSVQTIVPINNRTAIKMTTARYYTPSGRSIQAEGIVPDIEVEKVKVAAAGRDREDFRLKEADLAGHLSNDNGDAGENGKAKKKDDKEDKPSLAETDYELSEALNLLKGLAILGKKG